MSEKKLEYFSDVVAREVENRRRRARHQLANNLSEHHAKAIEAAHEKINSRVEAMRLDLSRKANKKISEATTSARAKYNSQRELLSIKLHEDVARELKKFSQSDEYENYLIERILAAKAKWNFNDGAVKLRPSDMVFADAIREATGLSPEEGDDFMGGFILQNENAKGDYTFDARLETSQ
jgi:vacuolar-type H+-ATPase subunit E/Vma4